MPVVMDALRRLVNNPKTAKFARTLNHADLPANWADDPDIVKLAEDVYKEQGERSPFFKATFGDWEAKRTADYAMNGQPVAHLTGNEFQKDGVKLTDKVPAWWDQNNYGTVKNSELGDVLLNKQGVEDSIAHGIGREKASGFAAVPGIIKDGMIFDRQPHWKGRSWDSAVMAAPVDYAGNPYVGEVVVKTRGDTGQYQLYLNGLEDKMKLDSVLKTPSSPQQQLGAQNPTSQLILGQKADNVKRATKVVDENGGPKRFFHGTGADFNAFDKKFQGQNYSQGNGGFSFTDQPWEAQRYAEVDAMSRGLTPDQGKVHEVYLNMNNPYVHNVSEEYLSSTGHFDKDRDWLLSEALAKGHDGILVKGDRTNMAFAFEPTQIKSVYNRGTFNPADPNIYRGLIPMLAGGGLAAAALTPGEAGASEPRTNRGDPALSRGLLGAVAQDERPQVSGNPIQNELFSAVHAPEPVTWDDVKHGLSYGTRGVMEGVLGAPAGLLNMLSEPLTGYSFPNIGKTVADAMGLDQPQDDAERIVYGLGKGASETVPYVLGGAGLAKGGAGAVQKFGEFLADSPKAQALLGGILGMFGGDE